MKRRPSFRDRLRANDAATKFYAAMADKPVAESHLNNLPPKRRYTKSGKPTEAPILKACLQALRIHPKVALVWRQNAGTYGEHFVRLGPKGMPDIVGLLKGGRFFAIEIKAPGKRPEPHQDAMIGILNANGALAGWATSVEDCLGILR